MEQVNITDEAYAKIKSIITEDASLEGSLLRVFVQGGGCSGMEYGFNFDKEVAEDDFQFEKNGITVVVDSMSMQYLTNAVIDFKSDLSGERFAISNPNAATTCGCGSSFSPGY